jgi:hypothetical protein
MNKGFLIQAAILFAAYKFAPNAAVKAMALGAGGAILINKVPYLNGFDSSGKAL